MKPREGSHGGCFLAHVCHDSIKHVGFGIVVTVMSTDKVTGHVVQTRACLMPYLQ